MRILIETETQSAPASSVSPAVTVAPSTTDTRDAGTAPPDKAVPTVPVSTTVTPATDAGGPPDWLIEAIGSTPANPLGNSSSNGASVDGGQGQ